MSLASSSRADRISAAFLALGRIVSTNESYADLNIGFKRLSEWEYLHCKEVRSEISKVTKLTGPHIHLKNRGRDEILPFGSSQPVDNIN